jgi:RluA family pseudouridine synthase
MTDPGFEILYESEPCLAVAKPPGVLTQAPPGIDSMEVRIKTFLRRRGVPLAPPGRPPRDDSVPLALPGRPQDLEDVYLGVPHRLDRPASGTMLFAKTRRAIRKLGAQFERRRVKKTYWACVQGRVSPETGDWSDFLRKVPGVARAEIVGPDHPQGRLAVLHYRVLGGGAWGTWLAIELETGRTHQIRVQCSSRGYPILGDAQYGSTVPFGPPYEDERLRWIALHAQSLSFFDPSTRQPVTVSASVPAEWQTLLDPLLPR